MNVIIQPAITIEWFKERCATLEHSLSSDMVDPTSQLNMVRHWLDWTLRNKEYRECIIYFYEVSLLRIVTLLLTRKYQNVDSHIACAKEFVLDVATYLGHQLLEYHEYISDLLIALFDPRQPFYLEHGFPRGELKMSKTGPIFSNHNNWREGLVMGDCVDGLSPSGKWELVVIDGVSKDGREVHITWSSGECESLSVDNINRIAKYGTRTGVGLRKELAQTISSTFTPQVENASITSCIGSVKQGDLIDAKDRSGIWYQACIMETREAEMGELETYEKVAANTVDDEDARVDVAKMRRELSASPVKAKQCTSSYTVGLVDSEAILYEPYLLRSSFSPQNNGGSHNLEGIHSCSTEGKKCFARVAFLGQLEQSDEWIDLSANSGRVAPLNTCSGGARGSNAVREEIKHVARLWKKRMTSVQPDMRGNPCFAFSCCPALVSPVVADVVQCFGESGGFLGLSILLKNQQVSLKCALKLLISVGGTAEVLSHKFLLEVEAKIYTNGNKSQRESLFDVFVNAGRDYLTMLNKSHSYLRSIDTDLIEKALHAMENMILTTEPDRMRCAQLLDPLRYSVSCSCIHSPYLSKRLGGLKILADLVERAEAQDLHKPGTLIVRSPDQSSSVSHIELSGLEKVTYTVVKPCAYSSQQLCEEITSMKIIPSLFIGETAHEALMQRSTDILQFMARNGYFGRNEVLMLWEVGYGSNISSAFRCLGDLVSVTLDACALSVLVAEIDTISSDLVTTAITNMLAAIAMRCRDELMTFSVDDNVSKFRQNWDSRCTMDETVARKLHNSCLLILWRWAKERADYPDDVFTRCGVMIEKILDLGCRHKDAADAGRSFPWAMQWRRCIPILTRAITAIKNCDAVALGMKTIRAVIISWLKDELKGFGVFYSDMCLPFGSPYQSNFVEYLEKKYFILNSVVTAVLYLKQYLANASPTIGRQAHCEDTSRSDNETLTALHDVTLGHSRDSCISRMDTCFDFIIFFLCCSPNIHMDFDAIEEIWRVTLLQADTLQERDMVFRFLTQLLINRTFHPSLNGAAPDRAKRTGSSTSIDHHLYLCMPETVKRIFHELLCNDEFICSEHLSYLGLTCIESYFKWICCYYGHMTELNDMDDDFVLNVSISDFNEWEVFPKVVMNCRDDKVASRAVKYVTSLLQRLADNLVRTGKLEIVRQMILRRCMCELEELENKAMSASEMACQLAEGDKNRIHRTIMFVNAILDESMVDTGCGVYPHFGHVRDTTLTVRVQSEENHVNTVTISPKDSEVEFMHRVAAAVDKKLVHVKLFRRGVEMVIGSCRRSVAQMGLSSNETILVIEQPETALSLAATLNLQPYQCSLESLPAVVLSNTPKYLELLFSLCDITTDSLCDDLWELIMRIPTSTSIMRRWWNKMPTSSLTVDLFGIYTNDEVVSASNKDKSICLKRSLPRLLYNMQIVTLILHSDLNGSNGVPAINFGTEAELCEWVAAFLSMRGIQAIKEAIRFITSQMEQYLEKDNNFSCCGLTPKLLLHASSLATRMLRGIMVRRAARCQENLVDQLFQFLKTIRLSRNGFTDDTSSPASSAISNSDECKVENDLNHITYELAAEWGSRIDLSIDDDTEERFALTKLCDVQHLVCRMLSIFMKFSFQSIFYFENPDVISPVRSQVTKAARKEFIDAMCNCFAIWASAMVLRPGLAYNIVYKKKKDENIDLTLVSSTSVLESLLMGYQDLSVEPDDITKRSSLAILTRPVAVEAITSIVQIACCFVKDDIDRNDIHYILPGVHLLRTLMHSILHLKPSIFASGSRESVSWVPKEMEFSAYSLYELANRLVSIAPSSALGLSSAQILDICDGILSELSEAIKTLSRMKRPCSELFNVPLGLRDISGAVGLLVSLASGQPSVLAALSEKGVIRFVIFSCVGIVPRQILTLNTLCDNSYRRRQCVYDILRMYFTDAQIVQNIADMLHDAHSTLAVPPEFSFCPESDIRSDAGYVGLMNMGCTCYMNSLLQILYMIPDVRRGILLSKTTDNVEDKRDNLVYQLKHMFEFLRHSSRRSFSPDGWLYAYKDDTGEAPIDVLNQQDAQEFLQKLCERLEGELRIIKGDQSVPLMQHAFGGKICNQMFKDDEKVSPSDIREREEEFVCISLDVRGVTGLEKSLDKFVSGETIPDFLWDESKPRVRIIKRQCLSELSDSVIFHLKRFEINFDTFQREKVNDVFPFPSCLNLFPYSKEGLAGVAEYESERPKDYYHYELKAVVVHSGTADSGHYFSYVREDAIDTKERQWKDAQVLGNLPESNAVLERRWIQFDDSRVSVCTDKHFLMECFGGLSTQHDQDDVSSTNSRSAYMLVYSRVRPDPTDGISHGDPIFIPSMAVVQDNQMRLLSRRVYCPAHMEFIGDLYDKLLDIDIRHVQSEDVKNKILCNVRRFLYFITNFTARSSRRSTINLFERGCQRIVMVLELLNSSSIRVNAKACPDNSISIPGAGMSMNATAFCVDICKTVLHGLLADGGQITQSLLFAPEKTVRMSFARLVCCTVTILLDNDPVTTHSVTRVTDTLVKTDVMMPFCTSGIPMIATNWAMNRETDVRNRRDHSHICLSLLLFLSCNSIFQNMATQWRQADAFTWVLSSLSSHLSLRAFFIKREVVMQLVDLFLADSSPLCGVVYPYGTRNMPPTSFVPLVHDRDGELPSNAHCTPDWSYLLETLANLVCSACNNSMLAACGTPSTLEVNPKEASVLDPFSQKCAQSRVLITHALKQARYCRDINRIIAHQLYNDLSYTNEIADVLVKSISCATDNATAHLFRSLEVFLSVEDKYQSHRANQILDGSSGMLILMQKNGINQPTFACVLIHSLFTIALRLRPLRTSLSRTREKLYEWAPWVLKFCFQFTEKLRHKDLALKLFDQASVSSVCMSSESVGSYIEVHGESEDQRTSSWINRAERTFLLVQKVLETMGEVPDNLIPPDAFEESY